MSNLPAANLLFELVSPERVVASRGVAMVTVPGGEGDYGVLPAHAPMITTVRAGVVGVYDGADAAPERIFVSGGFAEVTGDRCTVLANAAVAVDDIDAAKVEADMAEARSALAAASDEAEREMLEEKLRVLREMRDAVK